MRVAVDWVHLVWKKVKIQLTLFCHACGIPLAVYSILHFKEKKKLAAWGW
jgi:hypothetical protein